MVQHIIAKSRFGEEATEYLRLKRKTTRFIYGSAFGHFLNFYRNKYGEGKGFSDYLDRIFEELKKPRREQRRIAEIELVDFINYLKELGKSDNTTRLYFATVQNFLKYKQVMISATFIGNLPPPVEKPSNHKHEWTIEQIKSFVDSAPTFRDKAIITCLFQSGLGINELVNLNYSHIEEEFEKETIPICLELVRQKTFSLLKSVEERREEWQVLSDPLSAFVHDYVIFDTEGYVSREEFYQAYRKYCANRRLPIMTKH